MGGAIMFFTKDEENSIMYYQGAVDYIELEKDEESLLDFYSIKNAYEMMDMLLFPGIENEKVRLQKEKRTIDFRILDNIEELLDVYCNIYSAMCKYTRYCEKRIILHTNRVDRMLSLDTLKNGEICTFFSTSDTQKIKDNAYFAKKCGIVLEEVYSMPEIEHLDVNAVLGKRSAYPDENEILFPPFLCVSCERLTLSDEEKQIRDSNNEMPKEKYKILITKSKLDENPDIESITQDCEQLKSEILTPEVLNAAKEILEHIKNDSALNADAVEKYINWKKQIVEYLKKSYSLIRNRFKDSKTQEKIWNVLQDDIEDYKKMTDKNRKKYKRLVRIYNGVLAVLRTFLAVTIVGSFNDKYPCMKIAAVTIGILYMGITSIYKGEAISEKWKQRTVTYLRLDELLRQIKYLRYYPQMDETFRKSASEFQKIVIEDDKKCEGNTEVSIAYIESILEKELSEKTSDWQ